MRTALYTLLSLVTVNLVLFTAANRLEARAFEPEFTCSVVVATGKCHCVHTIVQECDPDGDIEEQCRVQCGIPH